MAQHLYDRFGAILVESPGYKRPVGVYSGFFAKIEGQLMWFTAAHCARQIRETIDNWPTCTVQFILFNEGGKPVVLNRDHIIFIDFQDIHRFHIERKGELSDAEKRTVELFDVACLFVPDAACCYLSNQNMKFFTIEDTSDDLSMYAGQETIDAVMFTCGVPGQTFKRESQNWSFGPGVYPLHPDPDDHISKEKLKVENDFYSWIPTYFVSNTTTSLQGVSGGPVVFVYNGTDVRLIGMQTQEIQGSSVKSIGVCPVHQVFQVLENEVKKFTQCS